MHQMPRSSSIVAAALLAAGAVAANANAQCDIDSGSWFVGEAQRAAGPLGHVASTLMWDPDNAGPLTPVLVVAGGFTIADNMIVNNIATWNGSEWGTIGAGFNGQVSALGIFNDQLIAAGHFTFSGGTPCSYIARWDGNAWQPLGTGLNNYALCIAWYAGRMYVGGAFSTAGGVPANRIASWDGAIWRSLGTGGANGGGGVDLSVNALTVFDNHLIVGGWFNSANGVANTESLARWNGTAWSSMGVLDSTGFGPQVQSLAVYTALGGDSYLYVGGTFDSIAGVAASGIARYPVTITSSGPWSALGSGIPTSVYEILVQQTSPFSHALIVSTGTASGVTWPGGLYRYASNVWNQYATEQTSHMAIHQGVIHASINGLSQRIGTEWRPLSNGLNGPIRRMQTYNGQLLAIGDFTYANQQQVNGVARLDATGWHPVGNGVLGGTDRLMSISDAAVFQGQVFVAGPARSASNQTYSAVLRWNGAAWQLTSAPGFDQSGNMTLKALNGQLYATVGRRVHRWNGVTWVDIGPPLPGDRAEGVEWWNGELHAYGYDLYRLNGATWELVADNPSLLLRKSIVWNGRLLMNTSTQGPGTIVELVGNQFVTIAPGMDVSDMIDFGGRLIATFGPAVFEFDGSQWNVVAGMAGNAADLHDHNGSLIVVGPISIDNITSPLFARLICCPADVTSDGQVNINDLLAVINGWGTCSNCPATACAPDITPLPDGDCSVNINDLLDVINAWGPCP